MDINPRPLNLCIATSDIVGPIRNGGIGTWYHALAGALAAAGHKVTLLYGLGSHCEIHDIAYWIGYYDRLGVVFVPLPPLTSYTNDSQIWIRVSHDMYLWLKDKSFDLIHFHEWRGHAFYSVLAKRQGLAFADTVLAIGTHSPILWHKYGMAEYITEIEDLQTDHMEKTSVEYADVVVSPSRYMIQWIGSRGWALPGQVDYIQYIQAESIPEEKLRALPARPVKELVFFGRLETRKGLVLFCDALDKLPREVVFSVAFLGKRVWMNGIESGDYIKNRARDWDFPWRIVDDKDHAGAIAYLQEPGRMAVICSLLENSPNTLLECLSNGIPVLATDVGGNGELVAEADRPRTLFFPRPGVLAEKIADAIRGGARPAMPQVHPDETRRQWLDWHDKYGRIKASFAPQPAFAAGELVSVVVVTRNRPNLLAQALESLRDQDYPNLEIVIVDDGSTFPEALAFLDSLREEFDARRWQIVRQPNRYLGAARNNGLRHARGEWVLFMDDDNVAKPKEVSTFMTAARYSNADILTCLIDVFIGENAPTEANRHRRWLPLGDCLAAGVFQNLFGDANAMIRKSAFLALGGYSEDFGVGHEDYELYAKALLKGYKLKVVPEALLWYRVAAASMLRTTSHFTNHMRSLRPYLEHVGPNLAGVIELAQGMFFGGRAGPGAGQPASATMLAESNGDPLAYQRLVDEYWDSLSWRVSAPIRNAILAMRGINRPEKPMVHTRREAVRVVEDIRQSLAWEITGPLRVAGRVFNALRGKK